jgi:RNA polymerase sigma-70 factor (ECF subfamily)
LDFSSIDTRGEFLVLSLKKERPQGLGVARPDSGRDAEEPTDEALMTLILQGDKEAIGCLFRRYARPVRNVGHRILRDSAEAEDLVQEVFLYVYRQCGLYDASKGPARSWLIQVAYTQALLRRRKLKSHGFYLPSTAERPVENLTYERVAAPCDYTVEGVFGRNGWKDVLDDFTNDQRETLRLHFFEGYTFSEIAEKLGQSYANVRNHHYRGLEKLRKHLVDDELNRR